MSAAPSYQSVHRALLAWALIVLSGCSVLVTVPPAPASSHSSALAAYTRTLERFVNDRGEVDFTALAQDRSDLDVYIRYIADTPLENFSGRNEKLAHLINSYNALSMFNVISSGIPKSHAGLAKVGFFKLRKLTVGGEPISLYDYENQVIRPTGDPRVHFALNCMAVSCPALPRRPFSAGALGAELEREARAFFARPENYHADHGAKVVYLSELLYFFPGDFVPVHAKTLLDYANRYAPHPAPADYGVRFTPYDWTVAHSGRKR